MIKVFQNGAPLFFEIIYRVRDLMNFSNCHILKTKVVRMVS